MQLTKFTDVGFRIVMRLAASPLGENLSTAVISDQLRISYTHATKVILKLQKIHIVSSTRGKNGGISLQPHALNVKAGWLARQLEGDTEIINCEGDLPCPLERCCILRKAFRQAQDAFYTTLDQWTIRELLNTPSRNILLSLPTFIK